MLFLGLLCAKKGRIITRQLTFAANLVTINKVAVQHRGPAGMAYALVCGLVLGTIRSRTGSVWPGMLLHTLNNLLVFAAG